MRHAITLAQRALGQTHPNPLVGAVLVANGQLLAQGWHARDGGAHAEIAALEALRKNGGDPRGATLYVTLEPCSTRGRTGACTDAIIRAGITRVVIGAIDPAPGHSGNAISVLQKAGIAVSCGVLADECADLNLIFNHRITTGQPFIAAKVAVTLDGKIATRSGDSRWITAELARADVMHWRCYFPAIGVGVGTLLADNPSLTARLMQSAAGDAANTTASATGSDTGHPPIDTEKTILPATAVTDSAIDSAANSAVGSAIGSTTGSIINPAADFTTDSTADSQPVVFCPRRLIFDRHGKSADFPQAKVFTDAFARRTLVITAEGSGSARLEPLRKAGIAIAALPDAAFEPAHFAAALRQLLLRENLGGLYVEGGGGLLSRLLAAQGLDYLFSYRAPKLLADAQALSPFSGRAADRMASAITLCNVRHAHFGDDQLMRGHIVYPAQAK